jgi:hypothetical protein
MPIRLTISARSAGPALFGIERHDAPRNQTVAMKVGRVRLIRSVCGTRDERDGENGENRDAKKSCHGDGSVQGSNDKARHASGVRDVNPPVNPFKIQQHRSATR